MSAGYLVIGVCGGLLSALLTITLGHPVGVVVALYALTGAAALLTAAAATVLPAPRS